MTKLDTSLLRHVVDEYVRESIFGPMLRSAAQNRWIKHSKYRKEEPMERGPYVIVPMSSVRDDEPRIPCAEGSTMFREVTATGQLPSCWRNLKWPANIPTNKTSPADEAYKFATVMRPTCGTCERHGGCSGGALRDPAGAHSYPWMCCVCCPGHSCPPEELHAAIVGIWESHQRSERRPDVIVIDGLCYARTLRVDGRISISEVLAAESRRRWSEKHPPQDDRVHGQKDVLDDHEAADAPLSVLESWAKL